MHARLPAVLFAVTVAMSAGCKKDPQPDPIADFSKRLKNSPKPDLQKFEDLARELTARAPDDSGYQITAAQAESIAVLVRKFQAELGPPITNMEQFGALLTKAGFTPHPEAGDFPAYIVAVDSAAAAAKGYPGEIRIMYKVMDPKYLLYIAVVRLLRDDEESLDEVTEHKVIPKKAEMLRALNARLDNPHMKFGALDVPVASFGDNVVKHGALVLVMGASNPDAYPRRAQLVIEKLTSTIEQTHDIWK